MTKEELLQLIAEYWTTNGQGDITGSIGRNVLEDIVNSIYEAIEEVNQSSTTINNYLNEKFKGLAVVSTQPAGIEEGQYYLAAFSQSSALNFTYFGITLPVNEIAFFKRVGGQWVKQVIGTLINSASGSVLSLPIQEYYVNAIMYKTGGVKKKAMEFHIEPAGKKIVCFLDSKLVGSVTGKLYAVSKLGAVWADKEFNTAVESVVELDISTTAPSTGGGTGGGSTNTDKSPSVLNRPESDMILCYETTKDILLNQVNIKY